VNLLQLLYTMGSVLSRLFRGCCKYKRDSALVSVSYSNEGNGKCTVHVLHNPARPPTPARGNSNVETREDIACINNGATSACGFDDKWASSQLEQNSRVLPNTTRENKTNIVTVKAINSSGSQIAKSDVAKDISRDKCKSEENNVATIGSHTRDINSTDIEDVNRYRQNVSYLTISIDIATM
jgi:hypothetical protein